MSGAWSAENPSRALALVVVDELVRCGVTEAVLAPGSRSAALAMVLHEDSRVRLHVEIDERSAGFLAVGLARASGGPAAVVTTSGTAVANLHPAVVEADVGAVPLVALTADRPPELRHTGANQTVDQAGMFGRAVRFAVDLGVAEDRPGMVPAWRATVARLVAEAAGLTGPPGPVHANLPFREPTVPLADDGRAPPAEPFGQPLDGRPDGRPWVSVVRPARQASADQLDRLAARTAAAERGLIVAGQSRPAAAPGSTAAPGPIHALAETAGWPVLAEPASDARRGRHAVGTATHLLAHSPFVRRHRPDLVVRIGRIGLSRHVAALLGPDVPQVLVDPDGTWHDPERTVSDLLVADVPATCLALAARLPAGTDTAWADRWRAADTRARTVVDAILDATDEPTEPRTARDLGACLPDGSTLVASSSMPIRELDGFLAPRAGLRVLANRGASGIDGTVSTALGVALAATGGRPSGAPDGRGPTVALIGDLALLHDAAGLLLSPGADRLDITFVVVDNDGGGIFHFLPQAGFPGSFERVFGTPHGRDLAHLARLYGLGYRRVARAGELAGAVLDAVGAGGLQLVHVRTDRAANVALHRRITAEVGAELDGLP